MHFEASSASKPNRNGVCDQYDNRRHFRVQNSVQSYERIPEKMSSRKREVNDPEVKSHMHLEKTDTMLVREKYLYRYCNNYYGSYPRFQQDNIVTEPRNPAHFPCQPLLHNYAPPRRYVPRIPHFPPVHYTSPHRSVTPGNVRTWHKPYSRSYIRRRHHLDDIYLVNGDDDECNSKSDNFRFRHSPPRAPVRVDIQTFKKYKSDEVEIVETCIKEKNRHAQNFRNDGNIDEKRTAINTSSGLKDKVSLSRESALNVTNTDDPKSKEMFEGKAKMHLVCKDRDEKKMEVNEISSTSLDTAKFKTVSSPKQACERISNKKTSETTEVKSNTSTIPSQNQENISAQTDGANLREIKNPIPNKDKEKTLPLNDKQMTQKLKDSIDIEISSDTKKLRQLTEGQDNSKDLITEKANNEVDPTTSLNEVVKELEDLINMPDKIYTSTITKGKCPKQVVKLKLKNSTGKENESGVSNCKQNETQHLLVDFENISSSAQKNNGDVNNEQPKVLQPEATKTNDEILNITPKVEIAQPIDNGRIPQYNSAKNTDKTICLQQEMETGSLRGLDAAQNDNIAKKKIVELNETINKNKETNCVTKKSNQKKTSLKMECVSKQNPVQTNFGKDAQKRGDSSNLGVAKTSFSSVEKESNDDFQQQEVLISEKQITGNSKKQKIKCGKSKEKEINSREVEHNKSVSTKRTLPNETSHPVDKKKLKTVSTNSSCDNNTSKHGTEEMTSIEDDFDVNVSSLPSSLNTAIPRQDFELVTADIGGKDRWKPACMYRSKSLCDLNTIETDNKLTSKTRSLTNSLTNILVKDVCISIDQGLIENSLNTFCGDENKTRLEDMDSDSTVDMRNINFPRKKRKRYRPLDSSDDDNPKNGIVPNKKDKETYKKRKQENSTQPQSKKKITKKTDSNNQQSKVVNYSAPKELNPTSSLSKDKYVTKAEYIKTFGRIKSPVNVSLSIDTQPKSKPIKGRRSTFSSLPSNEIIYKIGDKRNIKEKFAHLFGSSSEDEEKEPSKCETKQRGERIRRLKSQEKTTSLDCSKAKNVYESGSTEKQSTNKLHSKRAKKISEPNKNEAKVAVNTTTKEVEAKLSKLDQRKISKKTNKELQDETTNSTINIKHKISDSDNTQTKKRQDTTGNKLKPKIIDKTCPEVKSSTKTKMSAKVNAHVDNVKDYNVSKDESVFNRKNLSKLKKSSIIPSINRPHTSGLEDNCIASLVNEQTNNSSTENCSFDKYLKKLTSDRRQSAPERLNSSSEVSLIIEEEESFPLLFRATENEVEDYFENCQSLLIRPCFEKYGLVGLIEDECVDTVYICDPILVKNDTVVQKIIKKETEVPLADLITDNDSGSKSPRENLEDILLEPKIENANDSITLYRAEENTSAEADVLAVSASISLEPPTNYICNLNTETNISSSDILTSASRILEQQSRVSPKIAEKSLGYQETEVCSNMESNVSSIDDRFVSPDDSETHNVSSLSARSDMLGNVNNNTESACTVAISDENQNNSRPANQFLSPNSNIPALNKVIHLPPSLPRHSSPTSSSANQDHLNLRLQTKNDEGRKANAATNKINGNTGLMRPTLQSHQNVSPVDKESREYRGQKSCSNVNTYSTPNTEISSTNMLQSTLNNACASNPNSTASQLDLTRIVEMFTKHAYFLVHLCHVQNAYVESLRQIPFYKDLFKVEIELFEEQKKQRLLGQSLRILTELATLETLNNITSNLSEAVSFIVGYIYKNLLNQNLPIVITKSMTYLLLAELMKPLLDLFAKYPLLRILIRHIQMAINRMRGKSSGPFTEEMRKTLEQQIAEYNRLRANQLSCNGESNSTPTLTTNMYSINVNRLSYQFNISANEFNLNSNIINQSRISPNVSEPHFVPASCVPQSGYVNSGRSVSKGNKHYLSASSNQNGPSQRVQCSTMPIQQSNYHVRPNSVGSNALNRQPYRPVVSSYVSSGVHGGNPCQQQPRQPLNNSVISQPQFASSHFRFPSPRGDITLNQILSNNQQSSNIRSPRCCNNNYNTSAQNQLYMTNTMPRLSPPYHTNINYLRNSNTNVQGAQSSIRENAGCIQNCKDTPNQPCLNDQIQRNRMLNDLLSLTTTNNQTLSTHPTSTVNDNFRIKLPFTKPRMSPPNAVATISVQSSNSETVTTSSLLSASTVSSEVQASSSVVHSASSQNDLDANKIQIEDNSSGISSNAQNVTSLPIMPSESDAEDQPESKEVLNRGLQALSSIGQPLAMLQSSTNSHQQILAVSSSPEVSNNGKSSLSKTLDPSEVISLDEDDIETIDLTWIDDIDESEIKKEVNFVLVKQENGESEVEQQNSRMATSPTDSGIASPPVQNEEDTIYTVIQKLCICSKTAQYNCVCGEAWYCGYSCQLKDWTYHQRLCHMSQNAEAAEAIILNQVNDGQSEKT